MEWKHPSIIAMKGYPYTGKTSIAFQLVLHLRLCLLLDLDDILVTITPPHYSAASPPPLPEAEQLISRAFEVLCCLVEKQLNVGVSVIIDSLPLSRPQLDRLVALSKSANATKFVIVECKIERQYAWKRRFKDNFSSHQENLRWYKPRNWVEDVTKIINSYDERLDEPIGGVSRVFVNVDEPVGGRHLIQTIQTLIFCPDDRHHYFHDHGHDPNKCTGSRHDHDHHGEKELISHCPTKQRARFCQRGHHITVFKGEGLVEYEANCGLCENPVLGAAYACESCYLVLHKSCAEMRSVDKRLESFSPRDFPTFIQKADPDRDQEVYSFPENFACLLCREAGDGFSDECWSCIFESHLKCGLIPTIFEHDGHHHKLYFWAMQISNGGVYTCAACGKVGGYVAYACTGCDINYHVECALLPYPIQDHLHGGYKHPLELMFTREKEQEDYLCDHCLELMNPEDWYYHCGLCVQTYHLHCAFMEDVDA